jgi:hypothetical protein
VRVKITGFSIKMAAILDCHYFVHIYASNSGGISQENDLIQCIFVSIRPDSNVYLSRPTYIHPSELLLFLLVAQGGGITCPGEARVQRVNVFPCMMQIALFWPKLLPSLISLQMDFQGTWKHIMAL